MNIYKDQLEAVYRLIEKPETWTTGYYARNEHNEPIDEDYNGDECILTDIRQAQHGDACKWCLYGAAYKCGINTDYDYAFALGLPDPADVTTFNDRKTHHEVIALLKSAIDRAPVRP